MSCIKGIFFLLSPACSKAKMMANPFAYEEYRREKIRQKIEETRAQRVQLKVNTLSSDSTSGKTSHKK